jgi:MoaA/NifB/PqqE/SkfB family radical SAM enzyme
MISSKALPPRVSDPDPVAEVCPGDGATGSSALNLPKIVVLSHDRSCNLSCPSCRTDFFIAKKEEQDRLNRTLEDSVLPILKDAKSVWVTGSGDPFGSNHFRSLLRRINRKDYPRLLIDLHTNAQLFDERAWSDLELSGLVRQTEISIDAARPETYSVVRRGGNFQRLIENLRFIRSLRQAGEIQYLRFSFVVQALNFREMPAFAALGEEFCVDEISFNMIRNWGTFSADEFAENFIGGVQHPEHQEFLSVLEAPELRKPMVRLGNMRSYSASA